MPAFTYKACDAKGVKGSGVVYGESVDSVARTLVSRGLYPFRITKRVFGGLREKSLGRLFFSSAISADERITFTLKLAVLFKSGTPLVRCLDLSLEQTACRFFKEAIEDIKRKVAGGSSLSRAMGDHKSVFPPVYTAMVSAGEYSGSLDKVLFRLVSMLERQRDVAEKVRDVTRYPRMVMGVAVLAVVCLTMFVLPRYAAIFERVNFPLPAPTVSLIWFSNFVASYWPFCLLVAVLTFLFFKLWVGTESGRLCVDRFLFKVPLVGDVILSLTVSRWADVLGNLLNSGVPIIHSLEISAGVSGNKSFFANAKKVTDDVAEGAGLAGPVERHSLAPSPAPQMISAGETAGSLSEALGHVSEYFERRADMRIKRISAYTEPVLIIGLSFMVLFLALSIFLPMWDMARIAKGGG